MGNASQRRCSFSAAPAPTGRLHVYDVLWGEYLRKLGCGDGGGDGGGGGGGPCGGRFRLDYENTTTALMCAVRVGSPPAPRVSAANSPSPLYLCPLLCGCSLLVSFGL